MKTIDYYGTLGPSCESIDTLSQLLAAGMNGIRINLSHISLRECRPWLENLKKAGKQLGVAPKLIIDMQGPELRTGILNKSVMLEKGQEIIIGKGGLPVPKEIIENMSVHQKILMDDGAIELIGEKDGLDCWRCKVIAGGELKSRKSIALPGISIKLPPLSKSDYDNISIVKECGVTGVMQPFVRSGEDLAALRMALDDSDAGDVRIFAKLEDMEGVNNLPDIINGCQEIVIARGDLGNAMPLWELPGVQKQIASYCRERRMPFMVVTQMLNSMMDKPVPTRAEVMDIYNAVLDGASSVMLTGETAAGSYPVEAMKYLVRTGNQAAMEID